jgi:hypothetical protein
MTTDREQLMELTFGFQNNPPRADSPTQPHFISVNNWSLLSIKQAGSVKKAIS